MLWLAISFRTVGSICTAVGFYFLSSNRKPALGAGLIAGGLNLLCSSLEVIP